MISLKKKVPIALKKMLETIYEQHPTLIKPVDDPQTVVKLVDRNGGSDFFFAVLKCNTYGESKPVTYNVTVKPKSEYHQEGHNGEVTLDQVAKALKKWVLILLEYSKESPLFDDPIERAYYDEYGSEIFLLEPDAHIVPYSIKDQRSISLFYDNITQVVLAAKKPDDDIYSAELDFIVGEIKKAQRNMSRETKIEVVSDFKSILAKLTKSDRFLADSIMAVFKKAAKKALMGGNNYMVIDPV